MGSSNQLPFRFEMVYTSNATVGGGSRNRVLVLSEAAFAGGISKLASARFTGEVAGVLADNLPT